MCETWGEDATLKKADKVADIINRFLQALSIKCAREDGVRDVWWFLSATRAHPSWVSSYRSSQPV